MQGKVVCCSADARIEAPKLHCDKSIALIQFDQRRSLFVINVEKCPQFNIARRQSTIVTAYSVIESIEAMQIRNYLCTM